MEPTTAVLLAVELLLMAFVVGLWFLRSRVAPRTSGRPV